MERDSAGAPGEIIAYADSDVLFSPNWLKRSVEILETYPNVGMVTARPFRTPPEFYSATLDWARENAPTRRRTIHPLGNLPGIQSLAWTDRRRERGSLRRNKRLESRVQGRSGDGRRISLAVHRL